MDDKVIQALQEERRALQKKLAAVEATLAVYGAAPDEVPRKTSAVKLKPSPPVRTASDRTQRIRKRADEIIRAGNGNPVPTRTIVEALGKEGIEVRGKNPVATLSALLSNTGDYRNVDRQGWVVAKNEEASDVRTSEASEITGEGRTSPNENRENVEGLFRS